MMELKETMTMAKKRRRHTPSRSSASWLRATSSWLVMPILKRCVVISASPSRRGIAGCPSAGA